MYNTLFEYHLYRIHIQKLKPNPKKSRQERICFVDYVLNLKKLSLYALIAPHVTGED